MPKKIIKRPFNLKRQVPDTRDFVLSTPRVKLPAVLDLAADMSSIKDQGMLGSCVGFASVAMKEWHENRENIAEGKKKAPSDFSEQWVYYQCKKIDDWPGEEGTDIRSAMKVLQKLGTPVEKGWPYSDAAVGRPRKWAAMVALWNVIGSYEIIMSIKELKLALNTSGPVVGGMLCFEEFFEPVNGRVPMPRNSNDALGGHAVCIVGYNDIKQEVKFKNSWGRNWGRKGYGWISYEYVTEFVFDLWTAKDVSVTRLSPYAR